MTLPMTNSSSLTEETVNFFRFIVHPSNLQSVLTLKDLNNVNINSAKYKPLWALCEINNVRCFKLIGNNRKNPWDLYYIDLETPIVFQPTLTDSLKHRNFTNFISVVKHIKTNLLQYYSQEIEALIIKIKKDAAEGKSSFYTIKVEDQKGKGSKHRKSESINEEIHFEKWKKRSPFGVRNEINTLNSYTGREWVKFSKSWFIHRPPSRKGDEILHPAKFPETLVRKFITFFTKPGELVLDPFLGSGSTLISAKQCNRKGIGIELLSKYSEISTLRLDELNIHCYPPFYQTKEPSYWKVVHGNSMQLHRIWEENSFPQVDFCITSPPYWNQLERNEIRQKTRKKRGLDTKYSEINQNDLGNLKDYSEFLLRQKKVFGQVYEILRPKGYLVIITNNVFFNGNLVTR
ncbi:MAG: DNA methyltransferase [Candidatus Hodarchaeales archaeon]